MVGGHALHADEVKVFQVMSHLPHHYQFSQTDWKLTYLACPAVHFASVNLFFNDFLETISNWMSFITIEFARGATLCINNTMSSGLHPRLCRVFSFPSVMTLWLCLTFPWPDYHFSLRTVSSVGEATLKKSMTMMSKQGYQNTEL